MKGLKKGAWTEQEDQKLLSYIKKHGEGNWRLLPQKAGLLRCGKSCRLRWANYLRPGIRRGEFTPEEEQTIIRLHASLGNRWAIISRHLYRRTDNEIKNHWNTRLKKRVASDVRNNISSSNPPNSSSSFASSTTNHHSTDTAHITLNLPSSDDNGTKNMDIILGNSSEGTCASTSGSCSTTPSWVSKEIRIEALDSYNSSPGNNNNTSSSARVLNKIASKIRLTKTRHVALLNSLTVSKNVGALMPEDESVLFKQKSGGSEEVCEESQTKMCQLQSFGFDQCPLEEFYEKSTFLDGTNGFDYNMDVELEDALFTSDIWEM